MNCENCENCEEEAYVIDKLAKLLSEIAVIVNGPEPPLTSWSYHDLPEKVRALKQAPPAAVPEVESLRAEVARLSEIVNTPQADDFLRAVSIEAEHQRQRWPQGHDEGKTAADWFWLIGYLAGKAIHAEAAGNVEKYEHHIITTAAACANWHRAILAALGGNEENNP